LGNLVLYSTNPWITLEIGRKYRNGKYYVWCSEHYDPRKAAAASAAALIAPSSSPKGIFDHLESDCAREDGHSALIKGYRKTYRNLAKAWHADGSIDRNQKDEIIATIQSASWQIWRPVLFIIPRAGIDDSRVHRVPAKNRAAYGEEYQIRDLDVAEFEVIER
jgi:hypothetical protein